jgi:hypothetical protein
MTDVDDPEIEAWGLALRRGGGLRMVVVGLAVAALAFVWLVAYANSEQRVLITRVKIIGGVLTTIGVLLALAGGIVMFRARPRRAEAPIPPAIARRRERS